MKRTKLRMISAALAACMMTSVLPLGAMAQGGGRGSRKRRKYLGSCRTERRDRERCDRRNKLSGPHLPRICKTVRHQSEG